MIRGPADGNWMGRRGPRCPEGTHPDSSCEPPRKVFIIIPPLFCVNIKKRQLHARSCMKCWPRLVLPNYRRERCARVLLVSLYLATAPVTRIGTKRGTYIPRTAAYCSLRKSGPHTSSGENRAVILGVSDIDRGRKERLLTCFYF